MKLKLPGLECARRRYEEPASAGGENDGTQALYRYYTHP